MTDGKVDGKFIISANSGITQGIQKELGLTNEECNKLGSIWNVIIKEFDSSENIKIENNANIIPNKNNHYKVRPNAIITFSKESWEKIVNLVNKKLGKNIKIDNSEITNNSQPMPQVLDINIISDGFIQASKQGYYGDCWLLSQINAMSKTNFGAAAIKNCITNKFNGTYTVTFKNLGEEYEITNNEITNARNSGNYSSGDIDVLLLELAFEKHYKYAAQKENKSITNVLQGGNINNDSNLHKYDNQNIIKILTNAQTYEAQINDKQSIENHLKTFSQNPQEVAIILSSNYDIETGQKFKTNKHAYSIKNVETDQKDNIKTLTIIDPWDSSKEIKIEYDKFLNFPNLTLQTSVLNNSLVEKMNNFEIKSKLEKLTNANRTVDFAIQFANPATRQNLIKEFGGIHNIRNKLIELIDKDFQKEEEQLKNTPKDKLNEEQKLQIQISAEERYDNAFKVGTYFFYSELGLNNDDLSQLWNNPDNWENILKKYNFN